MLKWSHVTIKEKKLIIGGEKTLYNRDQSSSTIKYKNTFWLVWSGYVTALFIHVTLHLALQAPYHSPSKPILATPSRYPRTNQSYNWSTCNGTPDAVCFSVNQSSVQIAGICVYTGLGQYNYELELLDGVRKYSRSFIILFII